MRWQWILCAAIFISNPLSITAAEPPAIEKLSPPLQEFYSRKLIAKGIVILAHADVSDAGMRECARRLEMQLEHCPEVVANLVNAGAQMHVIGKDQAVTDLPMYRHMKGKPFEGTQTMDERGRGYGGLRSSCAEENLLKLPSDRYRDHRDICIHEFAHTIMSYGLDQSIRDRVEAQRKRSTADGKWKTMYAASNAQEFFAELTMWYFDGRGDFGRLDPRPQAGREWFKKHDLEAFELLDEIYQGRLKPRAGRSRRLQPLAADKVQGIKSGDSSRSVTLTFLNETSRPVQYFWIDANGERKSYGEVPAHGETEISTFLTHPWETRDADGKVLGVYLPEQGTSRIVISDKP